MCTLPLLSNCIYMYQCCLFYTIVEERDNVVNRLCYKALHPLKETGSQTELGDRKGSPNRRQDKDEGARKGTPLQ
jgi:hypothetical protein